MRWIALAGWLAALGCAAPSARPPGAMELAPSGWPVVAPMTGAAEAPWGATPSIVGRGLMLVDGEDAQPGADNAAGDLARQTQNPVADLISVPFQLNIAPNAGPKRKPNYTLNVQPVIP